MAFIHQFPALSVFEAFFLLIQGATIKTDELTGKIVIARVMHGGAADRSGLIHVGDEVVEVNAISVEGKEPNDVLDILVSWFVGLKNQQQQRIIGDSSKVPKAQLRSSWCLLSARRT